MPIPEEQKLEQFIHAELRKLPEREAPEALIQNVFAAIARKEKLPWFQQAFTEWPRLNQIALVGSLSAFAAFLVWAAIPATEQVSVDALTEKVGTIAWLANAASSFFNALFMVAKSLPWQWATAIGVIVSGMAYLTCVAGGMALAAIGIAVGLIGAYALTRWMTSLLFGVNPTDGLTFIAVAVCLLVTALLACYLPARRATKVDPLVALRYE